MGPLSPPSAACFAAALAAGAVTLDASVAAAAAVAVAIPTSTGCVNATHCFASDGFLARSDVGGVGTGVDPRTNASTYDEMPEEEEEEESAGMKLFNMLVDGAVLTAVSCFGLVSNIIAVIVLTRPRMRGPFHTLLVRFYL